jgi:hypothetical protein
MWWAPDDKRILHGAEAGLFRESLGTVVDMVRDDNESVWQLADTRDRVHSNGTGKCRTQCPELPDWPAVAHSIPSRASSREMEAAGTIDMHAFRGTTRTSCLRFLHRR